MIQTTIAVIYKTESEVKLGRFNGEIDEPRTHICSRVLAPLEIMQRYLNPELFKEA